MNIRLHCDILNNAYDSAMADIAYEDCGLCTHDTDFFNMLDGCAFE